MRRVLKILLPRPSLFRVALLSVRPMALLAPLFPGRLGAMLRMTRVPAHAPSWVHRSQVVPAVGPKRKRVALLTGCVQQVLAPEINEATVRLLTRHGCEVVIVGGVGCCGALSHHLGDKDASARWARRNIDALSEELERRGLDAVISNASGCGTMLKDYGFLFREDAALAAKAERVAALSRDVSEVLCELGLQTAQAAPHLNVAYHSACSLQHGQQIHQLPKSLLADAGFAVLDVPDGHLCCGSAGTYNLLQPELAAELGRRKVDNIESVAPDVVAAGNIGCMVQIAGGTEIPVAHTVELLDWATGGPKPPALEGRALPEGK